MKSTVFLLLSCLLLFSVRLNAQSYFPSSAEVKKYRIKSVLQKSQRALSTNVEYVSNILQVYDTQNNLTERSRLSSAERHTFKYDPQHRLMESLQCGLTPEDCTYHYYHYLDNDSLKMEVTYDHRMDPDGRLSLDTTYYEYEYDLDIEHRNLIRKKIKTFRYLSIPTDEDLIKIKAPSKWLLDYYSVENQVFDYNKKGQLTKRNELFRTYEAILLKDQFIKLNPLHSDTFSTQYSYDKRGLLATCLKYRNNLLTDSLSYDYDEQGKVLRYSESTLDASQHNTYTIVRDYAYKNSRTTKILETSANDDNQSVTNYFYDENELLHRVSTSGTRKRGQQLISSYSENIELKYTFF